MAYILKTSTIINISHQLRKQKRNVVFTHGTFDLFHTGHSYVLESSKKKGDILIVGVEPDANVKKYKSVTRPILNEYHRLRMVSTHNAVDFVLLVDSLDRIVKEYYVSLYESIKPNTVVLGKNFPDKTRHKEKIKGVKIYKLPRLIKAPSEVGIMSTTKIINRIRYSS